MMSAIPYSRVRVASFTVLVASLAAFSADGHTESDPLVERISAYWEAVTLSDVATAWSFEASRKNGESNPFLYYQRLIRQHPIIEAEIGESVGADSDDAVVKVKVFYVLPIADRGIVKSKVLDDRWTLIDGEWWHLSPERETKPSDRSVALPPSED